MQEVIVTGDLIDSARPGDEVDLTGRFTNNFDTSLNTQQGFPVFSTVIEANSLLARRRRRGEPRVVERRRDADQGFGGQRRLRAAILQQRRALAVWPRGGEACGGVGALRRCVGVSRGFHPERR